MRVHNNEVLITHDGNHQKKKSIICRDGSVLSTSKKYASQTQTILKFSGLNQSPTPKSIYNFYLNSQTCQTSAKLVSFNNNYKKLIVYLYKINTNLFQIIMVITLTIFYILIIKTFKKIT